MLLSIALGHEVKLSIPLKNSEPLRFLPCRSRAIDDRESFRCADVSRYHAPERPARKERPLTLRLERLVRYPHTSHAISEGLHAVFLAS